MPLGGTVLCVLLDTTEIRGLSAESGDSLNSISVSELHIQSLPSVKILLSHESFCMSPMLICVVQGGAQEHMTGYISQSMALLHGGILHVYTPAIAMIRSLTKPDSLHCRQEVVLTPAGMARLVWCTLASDIQV